jgi:CRP-like cAMP-binding protein
MNDRLDNFHKYLTQKAGVKEEDYNAFLPYFSVKNYQKGDIILSKGSICNHIFFIEKGLLRLFSIDQNGTEHIIQFAPENWLLSERESLYFGTPSDFHIDVLEESIVVMLMQDFIPKASSISPEFRNHNEFILQNHIRQLQQRVNLLISASAEARYLHFIKMYPDLTLRIPQWMIASYLGITPESLSRVRKGLAEKNFK